MIQWLRICLPIQGKRIQSLVWDDPTCRRATKPVHHTTEALRSRAHMPHLLKPEGLRACAPQQEKPAQ